MKPSFRKQSGFTLVELVISTALLVTLIAGIFMALQTAKRSITISKHREEAIILLQQNIEYLKSLSYSTIEAVYSVDPFTNWPTTDPLFHTLNIYIEQGAAYNVSEGARIITRVNWTESWNQTITEQLETVIKDPSL